MFTECFLLYSGYQYPKSGGFWGKSGKTRVTFCPKVMVASFWIFKYYLTYALKKVSLLLTHLFSGQRNSNVTKVKKGITWELQKA